jgi:eukaryotic-like serine/threonine-protein kinase
LNREDPAPRPSSDLDIEAARILDVYLAEVEAGQPVDPRHLMERHPEIASRLQACLDVLGLDRRGPEDSLAFDPSLTLPLPVHPGEDPSSTPRNASHGSIVGEYELLEEIARGGMGIVFRALQRKLKRQVALKMILAGAWAAPEYLRRFYAEAESVARLDHPNIVPIYDVGTFEGNSYFSMRLLEGGSLSDHLSRYGSDTQGAARLMIQVSQAVHHAHQRGVLHRDLKPSNILLDLDGRPYVVDFGLAKRYDVESEPTISGLILGTLTYMSPEQTEGQRGAVTVFSDIYGLGAILYALLTGKPPLESHSLSDLLVKVREHEPIPPRALNRRVERDLETICLKCLEKEPQRRYASAESVADDLARYLAGEPILAKAYGPFRRLLFWGRHRSRIRQAGILAVFLGLALSLWALIGCAALGLSLIEIEHPRQLMYHLTGCIVIYYIPLIGIGWSTIRRRPWALWAGLLHGLLGCAVLLSHMFGLLPDTMGGLIDVRSQSLRVGADTLPLVLVSILVASYVTALFAGSSTRGQRNHAGA